ncbi:phosphoadenylyl-sulfate reductase [Luteolibacter ambystomatis]|uniref:Phosphoadenosine 5'-phosphosulfate reductase n=1 Tax=Luteolibacter ambystomatis TaxID=2824561 RepID=A0A975PGM4_9BACT|nr:phosphoadenylyl-sulfate reductase [Luteolibacter ambystomatis]QUE52406.1 phosphoadenylyl-sulfate reductase [Luteolibacter ambystomatis]
MTQLSTSISEADALSAELAALKAGDRLKLLHERYGSRLVATTSFGIQAVVMLHLIHENAPEIPVVFIDTGYLFPETYQYIDEVTKRFPKLDLRVYQPAITAARMEALYGKLWEQGREGNDRYGIITKVEPMDRALKEIGGDVWLSGVRRSQSSTRANRSFAEQQKKTLKIYPILDWADAQVNIYMNQHALPPHPLAEKGYVTMGDWHSTNPVAEGQDAESTRFNGEKYECGLHLDSGVSDFQI